jgi:hypothetical protein
VSVGFLVAIFPWSTPAWPASADPANVKQLLARSAAAYQSLAAVEIILTASVEIPNAVAADRVSRYVLGDNSEAVLEIGSMLRLVANDGGIYVELPGHADRYLAITNEGDLTSRLALVLGNSSLAGLWNPVPAALRNELGEEEILDAFRYSKHLGKLTIAGFEGLPGESYEVLLKANNGHCRARFDGKTFFLQELHYLVEPPDTPAGYTVRINGRFETRAIPYDKTLFEFEGGGRLAVDSLRELQPKRPGINQPPEAVVPQALLAEHQVGVEDLAASLKDKAVLLVGEDHLYEEPPLYMAGLLDRLDDRPVSLLLELPTQIQPEIDEYLEDGSESMLKGIFEGRLVLQLQSLLRWAQQNRDRVRAVKAIDEPLYEIFLKRAYLTDTRNPTMATAIHREWQSHPDRRIVFYAGQLHLMKAGRYKVNRPSRDTAGARLPLLGVPPQEMAVIWLNGGENFHLHESWQKPGVLPLAQFPVRIPISYLLDFPIFGIQYADEAIDYFVNLGTLTRIQVDVK